VEMATWVMSAALWQTPLGATINSQIW